MVYPTYELAKIRQNELHKMAIRQQDDRPSELLAGLYDRALLAMGDLLISAGKSLKHAGDRRTYQTLTAAHK